MKRVDPKTLNPHNIKRHYTFFEWSLCQKCDQEFRREEGVSWLWFQGKEIYLCTDCSHNASIPWVNEYVSWLYELNHFKKPPQGR